jgi:hypothetical protein
MDDNTFDDLLKRKLTDYEDSSIDPSALDDFHERISNLQTNRWYSKNAAAIALAALLLIFTGINAYILIKNSGTQEKSNLVYLPNEQLNQSKVDSLLRVIDQIQCSALEKPSLSQVLSSPKFALRLVKVNDVLHPSFVDLTYKIGVGSRENIPNDIYAKLEDEGLLSNESGEVFLLLSRKTYSEFRTALRTRPADLLVAIPQTRTLQLVTLNADQTEKKKSVRSVPEGKTSLAARNELEKHYFNKLGIEVAPHADLMKGIYSQGTGAITPRVGLTADWVISPRLSLESGIDYSTTEIRFKGSEILHPPVNTQLGNLESATIINRLLSVPLSMKYRQWVSDKSHLILRAGYTPFGILTRQFQYNYVRPNVNPDADKDRISVIEKHDENKFFGNTITASAGLTINREKNKNSWEVSLFYEHGLSNGFDNSNMQLVGLRTAHWFKLK